MALGSRTRRSRIGTIGSAAPPPPTVRDSFDEFDDLAPRKRRRRPEFEERPGVVPFTADLLVAELDERRRPGPTWSAKACELGRSRLVFRSRRMCYRGRFLVIAIHLIDDKPTPLFGVVHECLYDGDGLHRIDLDLEHIPADAPAIKDWIDAR